MAMQEWVGSSEEELQQYRKISNNLATPLKLLHWLDAILNDGENAEAETEEFPEELSLSPSAKSYGEDSSLLNAMRVLKKRSDKVLKRLTLLKKLKKL
jgi:hypothetical protein